MPRGTYDAVLIGGGHNGLTCAYYLARAGLTVCVLERRDAVGGAAIDRDAERTFKEVSKFSTRDAQSFAACHDRLDRMVDLLLVLRQPAHRARHDRYDAPRRPQRAGAYRSRVQPRPDADAIAAYNKKSTGEKYRVNPNKDV